jgi:hypothetical protein
MELEQDSARIELGESLGRVGLAQEAVIEPSRRKLLRGATCLGLATAMGGGPTMAAESEIRFDFKQPLDGWQTVAGQWGIEEMQGASGGRALVQRATNNAFNVIVAPAGPFTNVVASVRFKPISGREDASAGIVFRFSDGHYYVIRANALEDNFNLYYYDRGRHEIVGSTVKAPSLGQWHTLRIAADGDRLRGWLNDTSLIDRHDARYSAGRVGLWTKADSVTAFDDLVINGVVQG